LQVFTLGFLRFPYAETSVQRQRTSIMLDVMCSEVLSKSQIPLRYLAQSWFEAGRRQVRSWSPGFN